MIRPQDLFKHDWEGVLSSAHQAFEALLSLSAWFKEFPSYEIKGEVEEGAFLINPQWISVGEGSVIEAGAYVRGPCVIGKGCQIRHGAYLRGEVVLADGAVVGHGTEVKHSIFLRKAAAAHLSYVGDSILGERVNLGAGTMCANLRFDGEEVKVYSREERIHTGMRKLGSLIGDEAKTGCHVVLNPGTILSPGQMVPPGEVYSRSRHSFILTH